MKRSSPSAVCGADGCLWFNLAGAGAEIPVLSRLGRSALELLSGLLFFDSFRVGGPGNKFGFEALFFRIGMVLLWLLGRGGSSVDMPCLTACTRTQEATRLNLGRLEMDDFPIDGAAMRGVEGASAFVQLQRALYRGFGILCGRPKTLSVGDASSEVACTATATPDLVVSSELFLAMRFSIVWLEYTLVIPSCFNGGEGGAFITLARGWRSFVGVGGF
jgi:hypothetical protein